LLLAYKILFGLLRVNSDIFFTPRKQSQLAYAVMYIRYTNSDTSLLIDATFSAFDSLTRGTVCIPKPRTFLD